MYSSLMLAKKKGNMLTDEFSWKFDVLFNNITSNQAPGQNDEEKSYFLTQAQEQILLNHFTANSKGNNIGQGFGDSLKREADFSTIMRTAECERITDSTLVKLDKRSTLYTFPSDVYIIVNESIDTTNCNTLQVVPLRYDEYTRLMQKPFKRPLKNQAWRLINSGSVGSSAVPSTTRNVEIITNVGDYIKRYVISYIKKPKPIILADLGDFKIDGRSEVTECELDPILHEEILQRAVELAKLAWASTGTDNAQLSLTVGQRSE